MNSDQHALTVCPEPELLSGYAACKLAKENALDIETHLSDCDHCCQTLVAIMDSGAEPEWLDTCRQINRTVQFPLCSTVSIESPQHLNPLVVWERWDCLMNRAVACSGLRSMIKVAGRNKHKRNCVLQRFKKKFAILAKAHQVCGRTRHLYVQAR